MLKRFGILAGAVLVLTASLVWLYWTAPQRLFALDDRLRDFLFLMRGSVPATGRVVIVDIDEKSLKAYGQWPWSRTVIATLLKQLRDDGAGIVGLDIVFAEADKSAPPFDKARGERCPNPNDRALASAIRQTPTIGGYFFSFDFNTTRSPSVPAVFVEKGLSEARYIPEPSGARLNIDCLQEAFYSSGFFNVIPDPGGMIRRIPLLMRYHGLLYPSLSLEMLRIFTRADTVVVHNSSTGVERIQLGDRSIPTDRFGRLAINFRGPSRSIRYVSARDVIEQTIDPALVAGKFVLIGTSAVGLADLRPTPFDTVMPGVEVHANMIDTVLTGDLIASPPEHEWIDMGLIASAAIASALLFYLLNGWLILPALAGVLYGLYRFYDTMLFDRGMILNILMPLLALMMTMLVVLLLRYLFVARKSQQLKQAFARKVSPAVMDDILAHPTQDLLAPRAKEVTVFFSDIRAFTTIAETIGDPEAVIGLLNEYLTPMVESIVRHHGTIDKFIGDAVMAYWNAPVDLAGHADYAVRSALEQLKRVERLNATIAAARPELHRDLLQVLNAGIDDPKARYDGVITIGIGIHTGATTIGEMGSTGRSDYTIIGDSVNLASRLEGLCKLYGVPLILSEATQNALTGTYPLWELDWVRVKGRRESVTIYTVMDDAIPEAEHEQYNAALRLYRDGAFDAADAAFGALVGHGTPYAYKLYRMFQDRCRILAQEKIKAFDGIFTATSK